MRSKIANKIINQINNLPFYKRWWLFIKVELKVIKLIGLLKWLKSQ